MVGHGVVEYKRLLLKNSKNDSANYFLPVSILGQYDEEYQGH
jgi:hypothetical protein